MRGFAKACLERILHDVSTQTAQVSDEISKSLLTVPVAVPPRVVVVLFVFGERRRRSKLCELELFWWWKVVVIAVVVNSRVVR